MDDRRLELCILKVLNVSLTFCTINYNIKNLFEMDAKQEREKNEATIKYFFHIFLIFQILLNNEFEYVVWSFKADAIFVLIWWLLQTKIILC